MIREMRKLLHPNGFSAALWPYRFSAMAFGHCNVSSKLWRMIYATFMMSVSLLYAYFVRYGFYKRISRDKRSDVQVVIAYCVFWLQVTVVPINVLTWFFAGHSCYTKVLTSLMLVDQELAQISFKHVNLEKTVIRQLACVSLPVLLAIPLIVDDLHFESERISPWHLLEISTRHYSRTVTMVLMSFFGNLVRSTGDRYEIINFALRGIGSSVELGTESAGNLTRTTFDEIKLTRRLRVIHRELFFISQKVLEAFAIQVLVCILSSSSITVYDLYMEYKIGISLSGRWITHRGFICVIGPLFDFGAVIYVAYCCHQTVREANWTTKILNSLTSASEDLRLEVSSFTHQLIHYQLHFSPLGFFQLDLELVQSVVASIATYCIILVQMEP